MGLDDMIIDTAVMPTYTDDVSRSAGHSQPPKHNRDNHMDIVIIVIAGCFHSKNIKYMLRSVVFAADNMPTKALHLSARGVTTDPGSIPDCITTACN
jgi:hypothetical protein